MRGNGLFATARPAPDRLLPAAGAAFVLLLALPVFLLAGWTVVGWGLACVLWVALEVVDLLLARLRGRSGNLAAAGVQGFGLFFKAIVLLVVLVAVAASDTHLAVAAALTYVVAYTFELGLSLLTYFGSAP